MERDKRLPAEETHADIQIDVDPMEEFSIPMTSKGKIFSVPDPYIGRRFYFGVPPQKLEIVFDEDEEDLGQVSDGDSTKRQK